jgi:hypothetical protein
MALVIYLLQLYQAELHGKQLKVQTLTQLQKKVIL